MVRMEDEGGRPIVISILLKSLHKISVLGARMRNGNGAQVRFYVSRC